MVAIHKSYCEANANDFKEKKQMANGFNSSFITMNFVW